MLNEVSVPSDFCLNNTKIKKMTKYQDLKNKVKRSWRLKSAKVVPVIVGAMGMRKNITKILLSISGNITANKLQLDAVWGSVTMVKRALGRTL